MSAWTWGSSDGARHRSRQAAAGRDPAHARGRRFRIVTDFVQAFTRNPVGAQAAADVLIRVAPETLRDFVHGFEEKVRLSDGRMRQLFRPFGAGLDTFIQGVEKGTVVDVLSGALEAVSKVLAELTKAKVSAFVRALFDLARKDLGISDQTLRDLVTTLSTRIVTELKRDMLNSVTSAEAISRYESAPCSTA